jgi:predicted 3-demethylubiquinone-9 3-methyltransferase (glyoxalase superfamily)
MQLDMTLHDTSTFLLETDSAIAIECHGMARSMQVQCADDAVLDQIYSDMWVNA